MKREIDVDEADFDWYERGDSEAGRASGVASRVRAVVPASLPWSNPGVLGRRPVVVVAFLIPMVVVSSILFAGGATAVVDFTAENVDATSHNGKIQTLTAAPSGTITYEGFEHAASTVDVVVQVKEPGGDWATIGSDQLTTSGVSGTLNYQFSTISILDNSEWKTSDFAAADGETTKTKVTIRVLATFHGVESGGSDLTTSNSATFDVTVENVAAGAGVGGNGNTNGSGNADKPGSGV